MPCTYKDFSSILALVSISGNNSLRKETPIKFTSAPMSTKAVSKLDLTSLIKSNPNLTTTVCQLRANPKVNYVLLSN